MLAAIDRDRYRVIPVGITREGAFVLEEDDPAKFALDPSKMPEVVDNGTRVRWPESASSRTWSVVDASGDERSLGEVDVVLPILHGRFGEDGTVQGLLELYGIPFVGAGVLMSAIGMDKHATKSILRSAGVPVVPWVTVRRADVEAEPDRWHRRIRSLGLPVFVKPARAGSSVGVSKVASWDALEEALAVAFAEDATALVEQAVVGREVECGVLETPGGEPRVSVAGEIVLSGREFYDFAAKYLDAPGIDLVCPADLRDGELAEMQRIAIRAFEAIGGEGLARVDFFFTGTEFFVNELNTMPGFTPISMFPSCWIASGMTYPELLGDLIETALARGAR